MRALALTLVAVETSPRALAGADTRVGARLAEQASREESARIERRAARRTIGLLVPAIFIADLLVGPAYALAALYMLPLLASLWLADPRSIRRVAVGCALLGAAAPVLHHVSGGLSLRPAPVVWMRSLVHLAWALFALGTVALLLARRVTMEAELEEARARTAFTLRSIAEAVVAADAEGRVRFLNRAAEKLCGWDSEEAEGRKLAEVVALAAPEEGSALSLPGELQQERAVLLSRNGRRVPVLQSQARIQDGRGGERGQVLILRDDTERRDYERDLLDRAYRDVLTGLPNRASLTDRLELELAHARRQETGLALLFLDLDGFKAINDTRGHAAGDALLVGAANHLTQALREGDTVARLGGDEFTVLLPGIASQSVAVAVVEKLLAALELPVHHEGELLRVSASIGLALYPRDASTAADLLQRADDAMYQAKSSGGHRWSCLEQVH